MPTTQLMQLKLINNDYSFSELDFFNNTPGKIVTYTKILESAMDFTDGNLACMLKFFPQDDLCEDEIKNSVDELNNKVILMDSTFEI